MFLRGAIEYELLIYMASYYNVIIWLLDKTEIELFQQCQRQQNTIYPKGGRFAKQFFGASDWFTAYNRGKVFN